MSVRPGTPDLPGRRYSFRSYVVSTCLTSTQRTSSAHALQDHRRWESRRNGVPGGRKPSRRRRGAMTTATWLWCATRPPGGDAGEGGALEVPCRSLRRSRAECRTRSMACSSCRSSGPEFTRRCERGGRGSEATPIDIQPAPRANRVGLLAAGLGNVRGAAAPRAACMGTLPDPRLSHGGERRRHRDDHDAATDRPGRRNSAPHAFLSARRRGVPSMSVCRRATVPQVGAHPASVDDGPRHGLPGVECFRVVAVVGTGRCTRSRGRRILARRR